MPREINSDLLLELAGAFGPFQWMLCAFLWLLAAPFLGMVIYGNMLILLIPAHWCSTWDPLGLNRTLSQRKLDDIPPATALHPSSLGPGLSKCEMYLPLEPGEGYNLTSLRQISSCQNGWEYDYSTVYGTVVSELNWVCDNSWKAYAAHTAFWAGGAVGVIFFGAIADRCGRRPVIVVTHLICAVFGVATNYFFNFTAFIAGRVIMGFAALPMSMVTYVLMLEYVSSSWRLTVSTIYLFAYSLTGCLLPWMAYYIANWRLFNLLTSVPVFAVPLLFSYIPESLRWMFANNQEEKAKQTLADIARVNGRTLPPEFLVTPLNGDGEPKQRRESVITMVRLPNLRRVYLITVITWVFLSSCYTGGYIHAATVSDSPFLMISANSAMDLLANAIGDRMANHLGRRMTMVISSALCSVTFVISCSDQLKSNYVALTLVLMFSRVTLTTAYNVNYLYGAEVYPTVVRTQALSIRQAVGAVGSFLSPQIVFLSTYSRPLPLLVFSGMALATSALCLLLPETLNVSLPETLLDGEALGAISFPFLARLYDGISSKLPNSPRHRASSAKSQTGPRVHVLPNVPEETLPIGEEADGKQDSIA